MKNMKFCIAVLFILFSYSSSSMAKSKVPCKNEKSYIVGFFQDAIFHFTDLLRAESILAYPIECSIGSNKDDQNRCLVLELMRKSCASARKAYRMDDCREKDDNDIEDDDNDDDNGDEADDNSKSVLIDASDGNFIFKCRFHLYRKDKDNHG